MVQAQAASWNISHIGHLQPWEAAHERTIRFLKSVAWSNAMWYHLRRCVFVRITGELRLQFSITAPAQAHQLDTCPFCTHANPGPGVAHFLKDCLSLPLERPQGDMFQSELCQQDPAPSLSDMTCSIKPGKKNIHRAGCANRSG